MRHQNYGQIIAGYLKGRKIKFSDSKYLRPMRRILREALFSALYSQVGDFEGLRVLDGFCGSGLIGLEFISRGASFVDFVDSDSHNYQQFRDNITPFSEGIKDQFRFWHGKLSWMIQQAEETAQWDVIWLDPPFAKIPRNEILDLLREERGRFLVIHYEKDMKTAYQHLFDEVKDTYEWVYTREFGVSSINILAHKSASAEAPVDGE